MQGAWVWTDGSAWDYTNWGINEPNDYLDGEDCLHIRELDWNDYDCTLALPFICKI
jgi:hypothetical protein